MGKTVLDPSIFTRPVDSEWVSASGHTMRLIIAKMTLVLDT
jgi:hypothetical protein